MENYFVDQLMVTCMKFKFNHNPETKSLLATPINCESTINEQVIWFEGLLWFFVNRSLVEEASNDP